MHLLGEFDRLSVENLFFRRCTDELYSHMTLMDQEGQVLRSGRVPNLRAEIEKFFEGFKPIEAVIETGRSSTTTVDVL
jgi:hypothetical protein